MMKNRCENKTAAVSCDLQCTYILYIYCYHSIMKDDHSMKDDNDVRSIKPTTSSRGMNRFHFRTGKI